MKLKWSLRLCIFLYKTHLCNWLQHILMLKRACMEFESIYGLQSTSQVGAAHRTLEGKSLSTSLQALCRDVNIVFWKCWLFLILQRTVDGEYVFVLSNRLCHSQSKGRSWKHVLKNTLLRWLPGNPGKSILYFHAIIKWSELAL